MYRPVADNPNLGKGYFKEKFIIQFFPQGEKLYIYIYIIDLLGKGYF